MTSALTPRGSTWRWRKIRLRILIRDRWTCGYCMRPATTVDHITPRALGGGDEDSNLIACCTRCQNRKGGRPGGHPGSWRRTPDNRAVSGRFSPKDFEPDDDPPEPPGRLAPRWSRE